MASRSAVSLSLFERFKIVCLGVLLSAWSFGRLVLSRIWRRTRTAKQTAPLALIDVTVGKHSFVKIEGVKFHYIEVGDKNSPPLLLLHGFPDCWLGWKEQLVLLSNKYRVIAIDLKGFGDSDKPMIRINYGIPQLIKELRALVVSLTENSYHRTVTLLAHDLGGLIGWFFLHDSPELVDKFVAVSAPHPNIFWDSIQNAFPLNYKWMCKIQVPWFAEFETQENNMLLLEQCCPHLSKRPSLLEVYRYVFSRHEDWTGPFNYFRSLMFWRIKPGCDPINTPILLIAGSVDKQVSLESIVRSSEWGSNAIVKIVDGAGHFPHQEAPEKFNRLLMKFLITEKDINTNGKADLLDMGVTGTAKELVGRLLGVSHLFS